MGLRTNAIEIMMVQTLMLVPVIQNMKSVMKICFEGDFANSQAFYKLNLLPLTFSRTSSCVRFCLPAEFLTTMSPMGVL